VRGVRAEKSRPLRRQKPKSLPTGTERLERSILGGIIDDPSLYCAAVTIGLRPEHFSLSANQIVLKCMSEVVGRGHRAELPEIVRELERRDQLDTVGGVGYVAGLSDGIVVNRSSIERDIECLLERKAVRNFCSATEELFEQALRPDATIGELVSAAKRKLLTFDVLIEDRRSRHKATAVLDGGSLLNRIGAFIDRFVVLKPAQRDVICLWVMHTHAFSAADATAYISVTSPEMRCGKSRLLEVAARLVAAPWFTARVSPAVLARKVDGESPTLLLDESDAAFKGDKEYAEVLRGILNSGHRRGGVTSLCVGKGTEISYKDFQTFCPKMIAGIGHLPDTVSDRSIIIQLQRRTPNERSVERFRFRLVEVEAKPLREAVTAWGEANMDALREVQPKLPEVLNDRQQDGAEPLLALADRAGGDWPQRARAALIDVFSGAPQDDSLCVQLLADIWTVFQQAGVARLSSDDLKNGLMQIETSPWAEFHRGKPLTPISLARLLKRFKIFPKTLRIGTATPKGYELSLFTDSWERYLPKGSISALISTSEPQHPQHGAIHAGEAHFSGPQQAPSVAVSKNAQSPIFMGLVADVAPQSGGVGRDDVRGKRRLFEEL
jgi:Protein of unknown function (DUF3631)/DnaB-like helicase N terminal domain